MKILIVLASGIGNSILFGPTLKALRKNFDNAKIDIFSYKPSFAEPFVGSDLVNKVIYFEGIKTLFSLRKEKYDISITAFPSNKWQFNLFAFLAGAKKRITHSYNAGKIITLSFLQNCKIPADENLHDVEQNLNLLKLLNINLPTDKELFFKINKENEKYAEEFIEKNNLCGVCLIGVHPGSGPLEFKRAPEKLFINKINSIKNKDKVVLIFGGSEEKEIKEKIKNMIKIKSFIINENLKNVAALIARCDYFITNDTGLMHIAVAVKKPKVFAFFQGTNPTRTRPYSKKAKLILLKENRLKYPFYSTKAEEE